MRPAKAMRENPPSLTGPWIHNHRCRPSVIRQLPFYRRLGTDLSPIFFHVGFSPSHNPAKLLARLAEIKQQAAVGLLGSKLPSKYIGSSIADIQISPLPVESNDIFRESA